MDMARTVFWRQYHRLSLQEGEHSHGIERHHLLYEGSDGTFAAAFPK
jgi:hypothetical protein